MAELEWEEISGAKLGYPPEKRISSGNGYASWLRPPVWRANIPGGWLVQFSQGITFVPDPEHKWDGNSQP